MILPAVDMTLSALLFVIFLLVLLGPFLVIKTEHNLEVFLFAMGILAVTTDHFLLKVVSNNRMVYQRSSCMDALLGKYCFSNTG
jgi:predicted cation transporter